MVLGLGHKERYCLQCKYPVDKKAEKEHKKLGHVLASKKDLERKFGKQQARKMTDDMKTYSKLRKL